MPARDLESIYRAHSKMVYWAAYGILRSQSDAGDVMQEVFVRCIKHLPSLEGMDEAQLRAWLYRVAVNLCCDQKRREKRVTPVEELPEGETGREYELPEASAISKEQRERVRAAIEALPEIYRRTVMLHYYSNLNYADIARLDGVSEGTVKSRIFRAKQRLYTIMKEGGLDG